MERIKSIVRKMWIGLGVLVLFGFAYIIFLSLSGLPTFEELENPKYDFASDIIASDNSVLGRLYIENRVPITYSQISPNIVKALIATEDVRFEKHSGVDPEAVARVIAKTVLLARKSSGGGSTITQQLAKLLYSDRDFSNMGRIRKSFALVNIKLKEWITAIKLERRYTKEEIIAMYLNKFNFIYGAYGIEAAAETYFSKNNKDLTISEAAVLVGMLKNPSLYNPVRRREQATLRRNTVLKRMYSNGILSESDYEKLSAEPIQLDFKPKTHIDGDATYFRMEVGKEVSQIIRKMDLQKSDGSLYDIYRDGLKIYTSIDADMQRIAEQVMLKHMKTVQTNFWREWKGKDPWKYNADAKQLAIREASMKNLVRSSDRYINMRQNIFEQELDEINAKYPEISFSDIEFDLWTAAEKEGLDKTAKRYRITDEQKRVYEQIMADPEYKITVAKWQQFRSTVRKAFNEKYKMKVFAYNAEGQKDTVMTPYDSIRYHRMFLQTGIVAIEPTTGQVKVWVGGINHKYFKFDHIRTKRQVGSTFKPFVYASAIAFRGISPCMRVVDQQYTIEPGEASFGLIKPWSPGNAEGKFSGKSMTLYEALRESRNSVSVYLMKQLQSTDQVLELVNNMGIDKSKIPAQPSICLGSADLTVLEMTGAYASFANNGTYVVPSFISRIEDKNGKVIYKNASDEKQALAPDYNYVMVDLLRYATRGSAGFQGIKSEVGGKTGTTNDYVDGWFMGITPSLVVGTWVGGDDRWIHFNSLTYGQGSKMARPFFSEFIRQLELQKVSDYDPNARFIVPAGSENIVTDCSQYSNPNVIDQPIDTVKRKPGEDDFFQ
ncbi:MAG TPA: transglycosylase domain-containing protein [Saprospiraceae bacterium]|nr:penicillin-binding protein [Candidatus Parvibacillus calidus]MBX2938311.1 penicillin-binding protein [Saprospiraceae bacterium]MBX7179943.1 penicillin-binding protein [Saprospiraceae bacterium]MCB0592023.1 penicillin-binding protein [Saprospiraceae bacterium]MCO5284222.1 penicillin-binding protein [Saprospiraceae bacterium]